MYLYSDYYVTLQYNGELLTGSILLTQCYRHIEEPNYTVSHEEFFGWMLRIFFRLRSVFSLKSSANAIAKSKIEDRLGTSSANAKN